MKISSSSSSSPSSHFFQIIHASIIKDKRLVLPKKFIKKFGEELSEVAVVTVPSGTIWHIELRKAEDEISFESGWPEFLDYYSIRVGHFLLFRYDGNSYFRVFIFDTSASEIEYPCHIMGFEEPNHETESQAPATLDTNFMEIPDVPFPWPTRNEDEREARVLADKQNESDQVEQNGREKFTFSFKGPEVISIHSDSTQSSDEPTMPTLRKSSSSRAKKDEVEGRSLNQKSSRAEFSSHRVNRRTEPDEHKDLSLQEKASASVPTTSTAPLATRVKGALEAARAFESENPFCTIIMRPSYVDKTFILHVPSNFAMVYLNEKTESVTLHVSDGRMWPVQCISGDRYTKLIRGWREFVLDNHLKEGDVCVFELVERNDFEINVSIFRVSEEDVV